MQSTTNSECIPTLEFPEIPNKDEFVVSDNIKIVYLRFLELIQKVSLLNCTTKINPRFFMQPGFIE